MMKKMLHILLTLWGDLRAKVVGDLVEKIINKFRNRNNNSRNIQTRERQVIIDVLKKMTHKKENELSDAAEIILKGLNSKKDVKEVAREGLRGIIPQVTDYECDKFEELLRVEMCKEENYALYKENNMIQTWRTNRCVESSLEELSQNDEILHNKLVSLEESVNNLPGRFLAIAGYKSNPYGLPIKSRAQEYADKWNKNVFLNDSKKEDKRKNIKLRDIYLEELLPHYVSETENGIASKSDKLKELLSSYIIDKDEKAMLLILGQPGIGKSTLITWIMANLVEHQEDILVYQFAYDLKNVNWQSDNLLSDIIINTLKLRYEELENKVLIFDGFDEIYADTDREKILNQLFYELNQINYLCHFSLIITCRENYIYNWQDVECNYITLQGWDEYQIKSFCEIYEKESGDQISEAKISKIQENKEVFGIPLILYMVLALNVTIEKNESIVDIYDQIFSLDKGSIYDRCVEKSRYAMPHRISRIKKLLHEISQRIAFWIFENNPDKEFITQEAYEEICESAIKEKEIKSKDIKRDVLVGSYFKLIKHCEGIGTDELQFVHRSLYEYFVVIYFFESIKSIEESVILKPKKEAMEEVAGKLGELLKKGQMSIQILEFIKYKFDSMSKYNLPDITKEIFNIMLRDGMVYHFKEAKRETFLNNMLRENYIFHNMLGIVLLWNPDLGECEERIEFYLKHNDVGALNLKGIMLGAKSIAKVGSGAQLRAVDFSYSYLKEADLHNANLRGASLDLADLSDSDLSRADLCGATLYQTHLNEARLFDAVLNGADLSGTQLNGAFLNSAQLNGSCLRNADIKGAFLSSAQLNGADLSGADLKGADLKNANLIGTNLVDADLKNVNLRDAYLQEAILCCTDLRGANLSGVDLSNAVLSDTLFDEKQIEKIKNIYDLKECRVCLSETDEVISYKEYCKRNKK